MLVGKHTRRKRRCLCILEAIERKVWNRITFWMVSKMDMQVRLVVFPLLLIAAQAAIRESK